MLADSDVAEHDGLRTVSAERTIVELAEDLSLIDLTTAIDCALHREETTVGAIRRVLRPRRRGVRVLRIALELCDGRSESPWETNLRLHRISGVTVTPQFPVRDASGLVVARGDLRVGATTRLAEYDGETHRDRDRQRLDLARDKSLARLGWQRYGYVSTEITDAPRMIVDDAEDALGVARHTYSLADWNELAQQACLTSAGRRRLARRLRRFRRDTSPRPARSA